MQRHYPSADFLELVIGRRALHEVVESAATQPSPAPATPKSRCYLAINDVDNKKPPTYAGRTVQSSRRISSIDPDASKASHRTVLKPDVR